MKDEIERQRSKLGGEPFDGRPDVGQDPLLQKLRQIKLQSKVDGFVRPKEKRDGRNDL